MPSYILEQNSNILTSGNYIFEIADSIKPPVADYNPSLLTLNDGDAVGMLPDGSGQNNHAVQVTATKQGVLRTNHLNGFAALELDGLNDEYFLPLSFTARTVFIIQKTPIVEQANTSPFGYSINVRSWDGGGNNQYFDSLYAGNFGAVPSLNENSLFVNNAKNRTPANLLLRNSVYNLLSMDITDLRPIDMIGRRPQTGSFWKGFLVRLVIYDYRMTFAERLYAGSQLMTQYAL